MSEERNVQDIMDTGFASALRRQFRTWRAPRPRSADRGEHSHKRRWLLVVAVIAVACAAIVAAAPDVEPRRRWPAHARAHSSGASSVFGAASRGQAQGAFGRPTRGPAPGTYGDELSEFTPGADGHIWAWGATHGTDKEHPGGPLLEVWDGHQWTRVAAPGNGIYGVAEPAPGDLWVAVTKREAVWPSDGSIGALPR